MDARTRREINKLRAELGLKPIPTAGSPVDRRPGLIGSKQK